MRDYMGKKIITSFSAIIFIIATILALISLYNSTKNSIIAESRKVYTSSYEEDRISGLYHIKGVYTTEYQFITDELVFRSIDFKKTGGNWGDQHYIGLYFAKIKDNKLYLKDVKSNSEAWNISIELDQLTLVETTAETYNGDWFLIYIIADICSGIIFIIALFLKDKKKKTE